MKLKKLFAIILTLCLIVFAFTACNNNPSANTLPTPPEQTTPVEPSEPTTPENPNKPVEPTNPNNPSDNEYENTTHPEEPEQPVNPPISEVSKNVLITYFSRMGEGRYGDRYTYRFAMQLNEYIENSTLFEIEPVVPYPIEFSAAQERASQEWASNARLAIKTQISNIDKYEVIFIGYPIWNGNAPRIIYTFLDTYDLTDKQVYLFATSSSSSMSGSVTGLKSTYSQIDFISYLRITSSNVMSDTGITEIRRWVDSLGLVAA
ncbi:MAG: hypothetical protein K2O35_06530 [Clostridia bacterium]|nr:hypothetical protein [Clostridia bacterium]